MSQGWVAFNPTERLELCHQNNAAASEQEAEKTKTSLFSGQPEIQGIHQVWNSAFSASYIVRLWGKSCPFSFSPAGWQQTSLQEDALEYFFPWINFSRKEKKLRSSAERGFLSTHTHICVFKASFSLCTVAIPKTLLLKIIGSAQMQLSPKCYIAVNSFSACSFLAAS